MNTNTNRSWIAYGLMLAGTVALYLAIRAHGEGLGPAPLERVPPVAGAGAPTHLLAQVLLMLAMITLFARLIGVLFKRLLNQPPVIGEILAGLMLGPSLFGALAPELHAMLLPEVAAPYLNVIAKVGVVLFMFLVGLELDPKLLRGNTYATIAISHASIVLPFLLGTALAVVLFPVYATGGVSFTVFSLFLGVALSVTAFPVLARILMDRRVHRTSLGATALTCAAVGDVSAWTLLALVVGVANTELEGVALTVVAFAGYVAAMFLVVRPLLARFAAHEERLPGGLSQSALALICVLLLLSAVATEMIGVHALFGSFLLGAVMPHEGRLAEQLRARLEDVVVVLFLPAFFAYTGMRTEIGLLGAAQDWIVCGVVVLIATIGKFGGTLAAARLTGLGWRQASALGILMNTRGLMELVVLNIGLDLGVISPTVFTMLVLMALVTTFSTTPILDLILGARGFADAPAGEPVDGRRLRH